MLETRFELTSTAGFLLMVRLGSLTLMLALLLSKGANFKPLTSYIFGCFLFSSICFLAFLINGGLLLRVLY